MLGVCSISRRLLHLTATEIRRATFARCVTISFGGLHSGCDITSAAPVLCSWQCSDSDTDRCSCGPRAAWWSLIRRTYRSLLRRILQHCSNIIEAATARDLRRRLAQRIAEGGVGTEGQ
jgi:hypothetical protein